MSELATAKYRPLATSAQNLDYTNQTTTGNPEKLLLAIVLSVTLLSAVANAIQRKLHLETLLTCIRIFNCNEAVFDHRKANGQIPYRVNFPNFDICSTTVMKQ